MSVREWLCLHGAHYLVPNGMGGTKRWCRWGSHWEGTADDSERWAFSRRERASRDAFDRWTAEQPHLRATDRMDVRIAFRAGFHMGVGAATKTSIK